MPVLGFIDEWEDIAQAERVRLIVIHLADSSSGGYPHVLEIVRRCREKGIEVEVFSHLFGPTDLCFERDEFSGCFRLNSPPIGHVSAQRLIKAVLDVVIGLVGSLATLALIPFVGLLIKLEDRWRDFSPAGICWHRWPRSPFPEISHDG